jgi:hypothetical protein
MGINDVIRRSLKVGANVSNQAVLNPHISDLKVSIGE